MRFKRNHYWTYVYTHVSETDNYRASVRGVGVTMLSYQDKQLMNILQRRAYITIKATPETPGENCEF